MESELLQKLNAPALYAIAGLAVAAVGAMCVVFLIKSWRAGLALGMKREVLKKAVISSATFTVLPAVSILLGVVALSGSLGIPLPWLRLSVIGNLQYEVNVAQIAATGIGLSGLHITELTPQAYVTIALVMTCGIFGGALMCIFTLKAYAKKLAAKKPAAGRGGASFGDWAMIPMFVGMCATYIGSYVGAAVQASYLPLITALSAGAAMALCEVLERRKGVRWLENFDLAACMLAAMAVAVTVSPLL